MLERYLPEPEQRRLIAVASNTHDPYAQRDAAWMRALLFSGCRIGEFSKIDIHAALHAINSRRLVLPAEHRKGGKRDHAVLATDAFLQSVRDLLRIRETITGVPNATLAPNAPLVVNRYGNRLSIRSFQKRMKFWAIKAGLNAGLSPHWMRHSRAHNIMRKSGAQDPRGIVQHQLGHVSIASTSIYTVPAEHEVRAVLEHVDACVPARKRDAIRAFRQGGI